MLISLPFLSGTQPDQDTSGTTLGESSGQGAFPLGRDMNWHGGLHFTAPGGTRNPEHVRAIADGVVVYARDSNAIPAHDTDPAIMAAHPLLYYKGWTSNGVVILRHDTEIGEGTPVTFYSIYQHLHHVHRTPVATKDAKGKAVTEDVALKKGDKVYRKDPIGAAGAIYGRIGRIHLEIVADEANVAALMGRSSGPLRQGRTHCVWGDTHLTLPANTALYATDPRTVQLRYVVRAYSAAYPGATETLQSVAAQFLTTPEKLQQLNAALFAEVRTRYPALSADQWFSAVSGSYQAAMRYHEPTTAQRTLTVPAIWGNGAAPADLPAELWRRWQVPLQARAAEPFIVSMGEAQGCVTLVTRTRQGQALGQTTENGYDLYDRAVAAYPGCPSAGYELMRFGRVLGPDALAARDQYRGRVPHIRAITSPLDGSTVYVDLNAAGVQVHSDADFPDWQGWAFIDDDTDGNSRCDSARLLQLVLDELPPEPPVPGATPEAQRRQRLIRAHIAAQMDPIRQRLSRCIVKMPTEWAREDFDQRWGWIKSGEGELPPNVLWSNCFTPEAYDKLKRHHAALSFWEDAQADGLTLDKTHYHFHPAVFVEVFRKCGWLSESELTQLLPMSAMRPSGHGWVSEPVKVTMRASAAIGDMRVELNKALRKFGISSTPLRMAAFFGNTTQETQWFDKLYEGNTTAWYQPWDGRGLLQLTLPDNYIKYWRFRGRTISQALKTALNAAAVKARSERKSDALQDARHPELTAEIIQWRGQVSDGQYDPTQSAGAYWAWTGAARFADESPVMQREIQIVNNVVHVYYRCESFGQVAATVNFGSPQKDTRNIAKVNGIVARYQAYANALVVLMDDTVIFPYTEGFTATVPEGFERRKP